ncbi:MAG: hypothetical protein R3300_03195 [Candidatus Promineifilaceae bacterium]|nr:hypothetical protein [Candidatus Promineifilaceae bacterium]
MSPEQPFGRPFRARLTRHQDQTALLLTNSAEPILLRFAFVKYGSEEPLFPALILDDWGGNVTGAAMYSWYRDFADQFPRAEVFGYEATGRYVQRFVREFEIYDQLACYAYPHRDAPVDAGQEVHHVLLPTAAAPDVQRVEPPVDADQLLRWSRLAWWQLPPDHDSKSDR